MSLRVYNEDALMELLRDDGGSSVVRSPRGREGKLPKKLAVGHAYPYDALLGRGDDLLGAFCRKQNGRTIVRAFTSPSPGVRLVARG